ncbi:MAG TPA: metalloregulator ArsR/SmtB family transcription factor [Rhizomicrobium sp.]|nr:metalloregulator ArsR/SmtB family transcription factor [Rhizomicrobium sp.]
MVKFSEAHLDRTFTALGHPARRAILDRLSREPGLSVSELAQPLSMKLPAMMKHLDVLADAGLIARSKSGRTVSVEITPKPMNEAMHWLERHAQFWSAGLDRLAAYAESRENKLARKRKR